MGEQNPNTPKKQDEKPKVKDLEVRETKEQIRGGEARSKMAEEETKGL
jgi:hypothetical protein